MPIGAKVTLRGERMYEFLDKLMQFHYLVYVTSKVFLKQHSMVVVTTLGIKEQLIFPEIDYDKVKK